MIRTADGQSTAGTTPGPGDKVLVNGRFAHLRARDHFNGRESLSHQTCGRSQGFKRIDFFVGDRELRHWPTSASQEGQDLIVAAILANKTDGFFVDLASNDAVNLSNTFALERNLGWRGLCIEPNPRYFWRLALRRCQAVAAVVSDVEGKTVSFAPRDAFGGIVRGPAAKQQPRVIHYQTTTLLRILRRYDAPSTVDYLSLDVEGAEELVLHEKFPFGQYTFRVLTVERPAGRLHRRLTSNGYVFVRCLARFGEHLYVHRSVIGSREDRARVLEAVERHAKCDARGMTWASSGAAGAGSAKQHVRCGCLPEAEAMRAN